MNQAMKKTATVHRMLTAVLAIAVSPLCLLAADYYTKEGNTFSGDIYAKKDCWVAFDRTEASDAPSHENNYWVVGYGLFKANGGEFGGGSLSLGLPADIPSEEKPSWANNNSPTIRLGASSRFTIGDFRLYSGTIHVQNNSLFDPVIAGTTTVYCTSRDVTLSAYINNKSGDTTTRRSINLASKLMGESDAVLTLAAGSSNGYWPANPLFLILSGDFSEYHGSFYLNGALILLNTATAFGCEADGAKADVYTVDDNTTMAIAADKSESMSRRRGLTIAANKTLTLTTTNIVDEALSWKGDYSEYTVTFPISGDASTALVKSGEGLVTLDSVCSMGTIRVDSGTLAFGANFDNATPNLERAAGAKIALAEGELVEFASVTSGGESLAPGLYTGAGGPANANPMPWITGTGVLLVTRSETPETTVADTWNGAGSDGEMSEASNWATESEPDLESGEFLPTFANAGSGAVVDTGSVVKGIVFNAENDFALTGDSVLTVLGKGITSEDAASARTYAVAAPLAAGLSQTWDVGENTTVAVSGPFDGSRTATVTKTGSGTLDIAGTNLYAGALAVTSGRLRLSGSFGRSAATDGALTKTAGATNVFAGVTINKPVTNAFKNASGELIAEVGTTNVFNGQVSYSRSGNIEFPLGDGTAVIYNDGLSVTFNTGSRTFTFSKDGTVTTSPLVRFRGRPSVISSADIHTFKSGVTCRFEVPGNTIMKYLSTGTDRLEATADYAWNGTDGIGLFTIHGQGSVIDVGSTRQCIQAVTINNDSASYYAIVTGDGGTLELAPTEDMTLALNQMRFGERVSLQKHGAATLTLTNKTATIYSQSYGDVTVTNGVLEFAADASWLNGTNVTVSGSGTLKINKANTFNREHAVIHFADNGRINVPAGVTQVFAEGWDGNNKMRGIYDAGNSSRVTGGGAIQIGKIPGLILFVR